MIDAALTQLFLVDGSFEETFASQDTVYTRTETSWNDSKILIVDDVDANLKVVVGMLSIIGCSPSNCDSAINGRDAVELFKKCKYDLVLMDCHMPIMDGYQATETIREWETVSK